MPRCIAQKDVISTASPCRLNYQILHILIDCLFKLDETLSVFRQVYQDETRDQSSHFLLQDIRSFFLMKLHWVSKIILLEMRYFATKLRELPKRKFDLALRLNYCIPIKFRMRDSYAATEYRVLRWNREFVNRR